MKLIIAEKPDVAKHIAAALNLDKKGGYYEGKGMLLTNMRGHLFTASNHSKYTGVKGWVLDKLPILPESLSIEVSEDEYAKKQIKLITCF
jgi:DNA topoisomerase-3